MSSQVNKSNVRFRPKVKSQRSRHESNARRGSVTINTTFSAAAAAAAVAATAESEGTSSAAGEIYTAASNAIAEEIEPTPMEIEPDVSTDALPDAVPLATHMQSESAETQPEPEPESAKPQIAESAQPAPISTPPSPKSAPAIPPVVQPTHPVVPTVAEESLVVSVTPAAATVAASTSAVVSAPAPAPAPAAPDEDDDELDEVFREPVYDEDGREVIEPKDLTRLGKYNAKVHFDNKVINADTFTMATLCSDVPIGEVDEHYHEYEEVRSSRKRDRALLLKAKQMVRGQYAPKSEAKRMQLLRVYKNWQDEREAQFGTGRSGGVDIDALEAPPVGLTAPKLVQIDGKMQLEEASLQVDRHQNNTADKDNDDKVRIEGEKFGDHINSYSFSNKERPERWSSIETETFYNALSVWGTDFNLVAQFFPQRTRGQIKTKFKYEEKRNPEKLRLYLIHRKSVRLEDIARVSGQQIVPVADIESDLAQVRREHEEQLRKEAEAKEAAAREDAERKSMDHLRRRKAKGITGTAEVIGELPAKKEEDW